MKSNRKALFAGVLLLTACKINKSDYPETEITFEDQYVASAALQVDRFINEFEFIARNIKLAYPNQPGILDGTTITTGQTEEGKTKYDIVFSNLQGSDNRIRRGKITVVFEDGLEDGVVVPAKHIHVRSDDENNLYTFDGLKFKGSLVFSNITAAKNSSTVSIEHLNAQSFLIKSNTEQIRFSSSRKSKWIAGSATSNTNDDVFEISDQDYSLDIVGSTTEFAEITTVSPSTLGYTCPQFLFIPKKGKLKIEHLGGNTRFLFLGSGNCSDGAIIQEN